MKTFADEMRELANSVTGTRVETLVNALKVLIWEAAKGGAMALVLDVDEQSLPSHLERHVCVRLQGMGLQARVDSGSDPREMLSWRKLVVNW